MSAQRTRGPWKLGCNGRYVYGDDDLAVVYVDDNAIPREEGEMRANARLIAAAPELLEADVEALDTIKQLIADLTAEDAAKHAQRIAVLEVTAEQLRAAIAKATGAGMNAPTQIRRNAQLDALLSVETSQEFARAAAMSAAWDGMAQSIFSTDGSWERARANFETAKGRRP